MALKLAKVSQQLIYYYSGPGVQYCCHAYTGLLRKTRLQLQDWNRVTHTKMRWPSGSTDKRGYVAQPGLYLVTQLPKKGFSERLRTTPVAAASSCGYYTPEQAHRMQ